MLWLNFATFLKVDSGEASDKENSREMCSGPPSDPVGCVPVDPPVSGADGAGAALNSIKGEIPASAPGPVSTPISQGNCVFFVVFVFLWCRGY